MKVKLLISVSGLRDGKPWPARHEVIDVPDQEGADMCAAGQAEPVVAKLEKAVAPAAEKRGTRGRPQSS